MIGEYRGILVVWTRWCTSNMINAILSHTLAVFVVGSTLVYCYDLGPKYDTRKYYLYVQEEWHVTKSGHHYHT